MTTELTRDLGSDNLWNAFLDLRKSNAAHLRLGGLILRDGRHLLYALEGPVENIRLLPQLLSYSPCEYRVRTWWREPILTRSYRQMGLTAPELSPKEKAWLRHELERPHPYLASLPTLLNWLRMRQ